MYRKNKIINWRAFILCSLLFSCQSRLKIAHSLEELQTKTMLIEEKGLQKYIKGQQVQFSEFQRHSYPIYIDRSNSIRRNNPFLKYHHRYQGFLLDKNDKIVLVGNPIGSDAMWSLFRKTLDNMLANDGLYIPE